MGGLDHVALPHIDRDVSYRPVEEQEIARLEMSPAGMLADHAVLLPGIVREPVASLAPGPPGEAGAVEPAGRARAAIAVPRAQRVPGRPQHRPAPSLWRPARGRGPAGRPRRG